MPSLIAHLSMGLFLWFWFRRSMGTFWTSIPRGAWMLLGLFLFLSMIPDLDALVGMITGDMGRFHNQQSHSLFIGAVVAILFALIASRMIREVSLRKWFFLTLGCYEIHILMDYVCYGRGVRILWPVIPDRFPAPVEIFNGLHWSYGWWHPAHLTTIKEELLFAIILLGITAAGVWVGKQISKNKR